MFADTQSTNPITGSNIQDYSLIKTSIKQMKAEFKQVLYNFRITAYSKKQSNWYNNASCSYKQ